MPDLVSNPFEAIENFDVVMQRNRELSDAAAEALSLVMQALPMMQEMALELRGCGSIGGVFLAQALENAWEKAETARAQLKKLV